LIDAYLQRRTYIQRYITGLTNRVIDSLGKHDKNIYRAIHAFYDDASQKDITALSRMNRRNDAVRALLSLIDSEIKAQKDNTIEIVTEELPKFAESEVKYTAEIHTVEPPSSRGIAALPVAGVVKTAAIATSFIRHQTLLKAKVVEMAASGENPVPAIRGTRALNYKDGIIYQRNDRSLRPMLNKQINGVAQNAINKVHDSLEYELFDWVSTLDGRVCARCAAAEMNSPYKKGEIPAYPKHPHDRCEVVPHGIEGLRPFVSDKRPVKNIPKSERVGKIGQTRKNFGQWFRVQPKKFQKEWLGEERYKLYATGKYKITNFVDPRTDRVYTLEELDRLHK
jgi:hypothetical protein